MDRTVQPYEISIWQDIWDNEKSTYIDKKILVIGDNREKRVHHAQGVNLVRNVNGTSTLTFSMYYKYRDEISGELIDNPFINMLVNERKIKIRYGVDWDFEAEDWKYEWKDFFIKTALESSDKKSITYTCKDSFITELSKNGFAIELDIELENNQGTVTELAEVILNNTDWAVGESELLQQRVEDYLYEVTTLSSFSANTGAEVEVIPNNTKILIYYNPVAHQTPFLQFLYDPTGKYPIDSERIVISVSEYNTTATYSVVGNDLRIYVNSIEIARIPDSQNVSTTYKGMRFVRQPKTFLDPVTNQFVTLYKQSGEEVYGYTRTEFLEPLTVNNFVTNSREMTSNAGWFAYNNDTNTTFLPFVPPYTGSDLPIYLRVVLSSSQSRFMNTGISDNRSLLSQGIAQGERFTLRMKYRTGSYSGPQSGLIAIITKYDVTSMTYLPEDIVFTFSAFTNVDGFAQATAYSSRPVTQADLFGVSKKYGIFFLGAMGETYFIEDIQVFKTVFDGSGAQVYPDTINVSTMIRTLYSYYKPDPTVTHAEHVEYLYRDYVPWSSAQIQYSDNYEKIRSITASKSNCFNLIQQLAETFECWARFNIGHNEDGSLKLVQKDGIWAPDKSITFVEFLGQDQSLGFTYGINLNTIQRNIESEQIVSRLIVEKNNNEFAPNGFCTIAYAEDNLSQEAFILNFDYFVQHGLIDQTELLRDLYITIGPNKGYLAALREKNLLIKEQQDLLPGLNRSMDQQNYLEQLYITMLQESTALANNSASAMIQLTQTSSLSAALQRCSSANATATEQRFFQEYNTYQANVRTAQTILNQVDLAIKELELRIANVDTVVEELTREKRILNLNFYKRYSRFIQEGSWIDENYIDHNLYYLDAQSVLFNSAFPQISYTINVIDLGALPEYRHYTYNLGDKTTIEDTEFFGYSDWATRTPYKEQVVISEISTNFDDPRSNRIVIQNFKSQFQDLFQRITASTNALQYNTGAYQRAADVIDTNGEINIETLQNSLINNSLTIASAQNESFIQDSNGITAIDLADPLNVMKLQSKGLFLSTDGGATWTAGIRANGINTQALTAGSILVDRIFIQGTGGNAFRWDEHGLNAYANMLTGGRATYSFVRFDNYGIYGINKSELTDSEYVPANEQAIWDDAQFGMTWRGFFIKNKYGPGWVEVSSENDVAIYDGVAQRIKLGNFGTVADPMYGLVVRDEYNNNRITIGNLNTVSEPIYGLRIQDENSEIGVYTDDTGKFYGQHIYIGPHTYDTRAELGVISSYIGDIDISTVEEYNSSTIFAFNDITKYQDAFFRARRDVAPSTLPSPPAPTYWEQVFPEYSKIMSVKNIDGTEQIALYDDGSAFFQNATISGNITALSGMIGGLSITETGFSGFGFDVGYNGMTFDTTTNPVGFTLFRRLERNFNNQSSYRTGDIVIYNDSPFIALQDMEFDGITPIPNPSMSANPYWKFDDTVDPYVQRQNIFSVTDNQLTMIGNGTFSGVVNASGGSFNGAIFATRGYIGGLILNANSLYSGNALPYSVGRSYNIGDAIWFGNNRYLAIVNSTGNAPAPGEENWELFWELDNNYTMGDAPFSIDSSGHVIANSIALGSSATITDYIQLGNSFIYNPARNLNQFITVKNDGGVPIFSLDNAGLMSIGLEGNRIRIDGAQSVITGNNWSISPDLATFSNVSVSGTIRTTVFERNSIQSVNSSLILADSSVVIDSDPVTMQIWVEYVEGQYEINDWVIIADNENHVRMQITSIVGPDNENRLCLDFSGNTETGTVSLPVTVTLLGQPGRFHIGINASDVGVFDLFAPRAITMSQIVALGEGITSDYKVVIGKLNGINQLNAFLPEGASVERYGIYSDFAYLKGSIVSETISSESGQPIYTGLNTLDGASNQNPIDDPLYESIVDDRSKIVFWAGAKGLEASQINDAPFKVTERGFLYARQGIFRGSVLSDSVITNSVIITDSIRISPNTSALHIYDTDTQGEEEHDGGTRPIRGIIFSTGTIEEHTHRVGIDRQGIRFYDSEERMGIYVPGLEDPMIDNLGHAYLSNANIINRDGSSTNYLDMRPNAIRNKLIATESSDNFNSQIYFNPNGNIRFDIQMNDVLTLLPREAHVKNDLRVVEDFILGSTTELGTRMSYRKVATGYDLFVEEE